MATGVNKVILVGNLGADPEIRYMTNGNAVANIRIATSESWKDKNTGEKREHTEWHRVSMYRGLAEIAGKYLKKGSQVYIEGRLRTRKWQGQDGQDRYSTDIEANEMQMLGRREGLGETVPHAADMSRSSATGSTSQDTPNQSSKVIGGSLGDIDDDIPF